MMDMPDIYVEPAKIRGRICRIERQPTAYSDKHTNWQDLNKENQQIW